MPESRRNDAQAGPQGARHTGKPKRRSPKRAAAKPAKQARASDPLNAFIDAAAAALALPVDEAWKPAIAANLRVTLEHAASVEAFSLPDDAEPAAVFKA